MTLSISLFRSALPVVLFTLLCGGTARGEATLPTASTSMSAPPGPSHPHKAPKQIYLYDARPLRDLDLSNPENAATVWDTMHSLAALQGIVNRSAPRLYVTYCKEFGVDTDRFWLDWFRNEDGWLRGTQITQLNGVEDTVRTFRRSIKGLVVYDPKVPATSDVASTAAGVENLLPVRYDPSPGSLYARLTHTLKLPVKRWLLHEDGTPLFTGKGTIPDLGAPSTGSAKGDAYRWAMARYLKSGKCDPNVAAYYVDADWLHRPTNGGPDMHTLSNHDYFIARRAFFFDLSPWGDEAPNDDPGQPVGLDQKLLLEILRALYDGSKGKIVKIGGFPPWPFKYTDRTGGKHGGVPTEWEFTRLISQFNAYKEADAAGVGAMTNASFFRHYPLKARYAQPNPRPTLADWKWKGYVTADGRVAKKCFVAHYVGDYDAPSWLYKAVPAFFNDPARGRVPLGWSWDPNLSDRAPQAFVYAYGKATPNDFFIAGDSGAGYLNPRGLTHRPDSGLPSGLAAWTAYNKRYYSRWDMDLTGFVLDGASGASTDTEWAAYKTFSPMGLGTHFERGPALHLGVPAAPERDLPDNPDEAAAVIARDAAGTEKGSTFQWRRSILKSPEWYARVSDTLREKYPQANVEVVDPYTFFGLIKLHLGGKG